METKMKSHGRKVVRVVARVKPSTDLVSTRSISVHKPMGEDSETVSISFGAQFAGSKDSYKLDYCYEENETTGSILTKEIKPLISTVFEGKDANVIAQGARNGGKTHLIQGNERELGLTVLTMSEMLSMAEERGDSVSVSVYEVSQETVYDLLGQEKRVVAVLEGAQGKIQLKGLSQVPVKSLSEFQNLYYGLKKSQKLTSDPPVRSHKGVMIHVTTGNANPGSLGRMNFLDMAGYEDSRKQKSALAPLEIARINKSIYALQNVMYALNTNESHVPYRESKLTRMLKDCFKGCNRTLLITCLPRKFSQDSFYMLNLASRICLGSNRAMNNPTKKKINGPERSISLSSAAQRRQTPLNVSATSRKQTMLRGSVTERKTKINTAASAIKARKLFGEANDSVKCKNSSKKVISTSKVVSSIQASSPKEEICSSFTVTDSQSSLVEEEYSLAFSSYAVAMEPGYSTSASLSSEAVDITEKETPWKHKEIFSGATHCDDAFTEKAQIVKRDENNSVIDDLALVINKGENLDKENNSLLANETASPPLSMRLQELSNNLKSICKISNQLSVPEKYQSPLTILQAEEASEHSDITAEAAVSGELRTPERTMPSNIGCSPWKAYSAHSSKLKNSAVGEYLKFINTAGKEDLKKLKGIGDKRAAYIVELREESPFKTVDDLKSIGLSAKQVKGLLKKEIGEIFE
ncbi:kinesin-like protein KIN-10C isoform X2 [Arabidopsis lyrata subsp. lyrata]|uniref:kinesin-like protein KIN-10C isoform X2 n=1 Tax=Arabidopsis lyrata subsp. lyrata TaxID=81972 RepID=UPI000A29C138|nr:kinesin-like protein KIN-10C isoform X2 [Arabidopsis lyrata subsp. lyrata]|eukprot:XP_020878510.1 kinesin-like protein KIN-10C isoform X2 [Arabidopsis lyrata subsp. lyrata]